MSRKSVRVGSARADFLDRQAFIVTCVDWMKGASARHVVTLNPEMVVLVETDRAFQEVLERSDLNIPDGVGMLWARTYLSLPKATPRWWRFLRSWRFSGERLSGVDVIPELGSICLDQGRAMYLLGGRDGVAQAAGEQLQRLLPGLRVITGPERDVDLEDESIVKDVVTHNAGVLLVAYGAPVQSIWIDRYLANLPPGCVAMGVGGAFDMLSGRRRRAPKVWRLLHIEWLWRLMLEPGRWRRIWRAVGEFPRVVIRHGATEEIS